MERCALASWATSTINNIDKGIPLASRTKLPWQSANGGVKAGGGTSPGLTFPWWNRRNIDRQLAFWRIISFFEASTQGQCCGHEVLLDLVRSLQRRQSRIVILHPSQESLQYWKKCLKFWIRSAPLSKTFFLLGLGKEDFTTFVLASIGTTMIVSCYSGIPHGDTAAVCR